MKFKGDLTPSVLLAAHKFMSWFVEPLCSFLTRTRSTRSQQGVDSFPRWCVSSACHLFHISSGVFCYATCQLCDPPIRHATCSHEPRFSVLRDFHSRKEVPPNPKPPIRDISKHQISWLSFLLDQQFRSHHDLTTWDFVEKRPPPPSSWYPNSRDNPDPYHLSSKMDAPDLFGISWVKSYDSCPLYLSVAKMSK
jgi:hypothetical protein